MLCGVPNAAWTVPTYLFHAADDPTGPQGVLFAALDDQIDIAVVDVDMLALAKRRQRAAIIERDAVALADDVIRDQPDKLPLFDLDGFAAFELADADAVTLQIAEDPDVAAAIELARILQVIITGFNCTQQPSHNVTAMPPHRRVEFRHGEGRFGMFRKSGINYRLRHRYDPLRTNGQRLLYC